MSRIFEALQRSESERVAFSFPEPPELANELLQEVEAQVAPEETTIKVPLTKPQAAEWEKESAPACSLELGEFPRRHLQLPADTRLVSLTDREGLAAEKFRFLGVRLRQMQRTRRLKKLLITSTLPEEGKSLVSANLTITLARRKQQRVLLIEGDLRRPVHAVQFGLGRAAGLSEWLQSGSNQVSNIYCLEEAGIWLMPAGSPPENPLELMQSGRLAGLLELLVPRFDWVIIDSPPVLPLADTSVWSRMSDGLLLVVREGRSEKRQIQRGLAAIDSSRLLGVVVNSCSDTHHEDYYARYSPTATDARQPDRSQQDRGQQDQEPAKKELQ